MINIQLVDNVSVCADEAAEFHTVSQYCAISASFKVRVELGR
jgi:hypothetical protein